MNKITKITEITKITRFGGGGSPVINEVTIGTQTWLVDNFNLSTTPMGNTIPEVTSSATWITAQALYDDAITGGATVYEATQAAAMWCNYDNDSATYGEYGKLYNWWAASLIQLDIDLYNASNPDYGYHVPSTTELTTLKDYLGGGTVAGGKLKETGTDHWDSPNTGATNESGFTAYGSGYRLESDGGFTNIKIYSFFWTSTSISSTNARAGSLINTGADFTSGSNLLKERGVSLRLIKD